MSPQPRTHERPMVRCPGLLPAALYALGVAALASVSAQAAEIRVSYPALETLVRKTLFVQESRYYLDGDPSQPCRYVFLESPRVGTDGGRLTLRMHLSARAAVELRGRCVGPADSMDVVVSGLPTVAAGEVFLSDLTVDAPGKTYLGQLTSFVEQDLRQRLRVSIRPELEAALVVVSGFLGSPLTLEQLRIGPVTADPHGLRIGIDFSLVLGP
jgi:hypothetical protein